MILKANDVLTEGEMHMAFNIAENISGLFPDLTTMPKEKLLEVVMFIAVLMKVGLTMEEMANMPKVLH